MQLIYDKLSHEERPDASEYMTFGNGMCAPRLQAFVLTEIDIIKMLKMMSSETGTEHLRGCLELMSMRFPRPVTAGTEITFTIDGGPFNFKNID